MGLIGKHNHGSDDHAEPWLVSYADMMTLLFGFFVILYSLSQVDEKKFSDFGRELAKAFKGEVDKSQAEVGMMMEARQMRALQLLVAMLNLGENVEKAVENIEKKVLEAKNLEAAKDMLTSTLKQDSDPNLKDLKMDVMKKENRIEIALPDQTLFASGTADINPKAHGGLKRLAGVLSRMKGLASIDVTGHTDSLPPSKGSKYPSNWALSAARAGAVTEELLKYGLDPKFVSARGLASLQPLFPERRDNGSLIYENLSKNRRVQIVIKKATYGEGR